MDDLPHAANLRWGRHSEPGSAYHITKCRDVRSSLILSDPAAAEVIIGSIDWHRRDGHARLLAFVVMQDHVHWLFVLGETRTLSEVVHGFASFTWRELRKVYGHGIGKVWEDEYHDRGLRATERNWGTIGYVHLNPVRAGLCENPEEWPWSTAHPRFSEWVEADLLW